MDRSARAACSRSLSPDTRVSFRVNLITGMSRIPRVFRIPLPSTYTQIEEITTGGTDSQQGLIATCKDLAYKKTKSTGGSRFVA
jgi:hypothetical protein